MENDTNSEVWNTEWSLSGNIYLDNFLETANVLITIAVVIGNILTIVSVIKFGLLKTNINTLICALSCADLYVGIISFIYNEIAFYDLTRANLTAYYLAYTPLPVGYMISVSHLAAISIDRLIAVMFPLRYHSLMTKRRIAFLIVSAIAVPVTYGVITCPLNIAYFETRPEVSAYTDYGFTLYNVVVGVIVVGCYVVIIPVVYKQAKMINDRSQDERKLIKKELKATMTLGFVVIIYIITWLPFFALSLAYYNTNLPLAYYWTFVFLVLACNSGINFIIYAFRSKEFRFAYLQLLTCGRQTRRIQDSSTGTGFRASVPQ